MGADTGDLSRLAGDLGRAPSRVAHGAERDVAATLKSTRRDAEQLAAVLTGRLRSRIGIRQVGLAGEVYSDTEYDEYVEYGTSDTPAQPFMRPAVAVNEPRLADRLGDTGEDIL